MNITLGVSSSISSYKAAEILRLLQKSGHTVRVAMTRNATRFIRPILFQSLSGFPVYLDEFRAKSGEVMHIDAARDTDLLLVAPATANVIGKFAGGIADDFLSTLFLAIRCPVLIAPAMNLYMYRNPVVRRNMDLLQSIGVQFVDPEEGYLACGDEGAGRLAPEELIVEKALGILRTSGSLKGKRVLVTAGPTWERLDPVRVLTNRSTGKMGFAVAQEASNRGAEVTLISGPTTLNPPAGVKLVNVESSADMKNAVEAAFPEADYLVKTAAVSDFRPSAVLARKKKKNEESESLSLERTEDILKSVAALKRNQIIVGFCAETENLEANALEKLAGKNLDFIVANEIGNGHNPFGSESNKALFLGRDGYKEMLELQTKQSLAAKIWDLILERSGNTNPEN